MIDERFWTHRRRSTSIAGIVTAELALLLTGYFYFFRHVWRWDLFAVGMTFLVVKLGLMVWYRFTD